MYKFFKRGACDRGDNCRFLHVAKGKGKGVDDAPKKAEDDKEGKVLNRVIRWTDEGLEYEADPRQGEKLVKEFGLQGTNGVSTPATRPNIGTIT